MADKQTLIIDDNTNNILVLEQCLSIENISAVSLSSTSNLSNKLDGMTAIELVFLDLEMPGMSGYDVLRVIKAHPNFKSAKIVAYSVHVSEFETVMEMGFDGFLGKPLSAEAFSDQLKHILHGKPVWYLP